MLEDLLAHPVVLLLAVADIALKVGVPLLALWFLLGLRRDQQRLHQDMEELKRILARLAPPTA